MDKIKAYIEKNRIFVFFVGFILILIIFFLFTFLIDYAKTNQEHNANKPTPVPNETIKTTEVTDLKSSYSKSSNEVNISWKIKKNDSIIQSVALYEGETYLADINGLSSYTLPLNIYKFNTGRNEFKIIITLDDGSKIEKSISQDIPYVFNVNTTLEKVIGGYQVKVRYSYAQNMEVKTVPGITSSKTGAWTYQSSTLIEGNDFYRMKETMYFLDTSSLAPGNHEVSIRWIFSDFSLNFDDKIQIEVSQPETPQTPEEPEAPSEPEENGEEDPNETENKEMNTTSE